VVAAAAGQNQVDRDQAAAAAARAGI